ncbi:hypothetical protein ADK57_30150 [Streptomyces sp. MMG1533]|uniref:eCIS core domain-containing protein n=1 Tax=Streptomyces sp. MMG1533 TaxID=1415546 RepID=UPI0006AE7561|nr:DUF4157 domain-containing protein [Streptomyces sp. MMG1533]KOU60506.1 hypothetical protein ADK57_30150 [Streptomyces sp. MMG1533]
MNPQSQDARSEQTAEERRRKRKERTAKSRTPEPKDIVSGAGQPLDPGVRRDLEDRLGHDLSRVRLHTGRDAGHLTDLLGADAVAVGQDVFFAEGTFKPGTDEGRRLLAHELLHTVQNPHGLGTLRVGRELGAVSLPQQAIEREAESAAQDLVRGEAEARPATADVEQGQATPGWLRYATVDADRRRMEQLDPATVVDRLTNGVLRSLRGDPEDRSGRVRLQLARMAPQVQDIVLERLEQRLPTPVLDHLLEVVQETEEAGPLPWEAAAAPPAVPGAGEEVEEERRRASAEEQQEAGERTDAPRDGDGGREADGRTGPGGRRDEETEGAEGAGDSKDAEDAAGQENAPGEKGAAREREASAGQQQERSQERQEDRNASGQDAQKDAADEREGAADAETEQKEQDRSDERKAQEETEGAQDEATPEPEKQAGEQEPRQSEGTGGSEVASRQATAPGAVDRSGAEPGERTRTGGDAAPARAAGDPSNEEDAGDEPLGLESVAEDDAEAPDAEPDEQDGTGAVPDIDLVGATPAAKNPTLVEQRKKDPARPMSPRSVDGSAIPSGPEQGERASDTSRGADSNAAENDSEDQDPFAALSAEQDSGAGEESGAGSELRAGGEATTAPLAESADRDWDRKHTEARREDADARRRDEEAPTADGAPGGTAAPGPGPGETAAPGQLDKAGEDARKQETGTSSSVSAASATDGRRGGTEEQGGGRGTDTAGSAQQKQSKQTGAGPQESTGRGGDASGQGDSAPEPAPETGAPDVTEGRGPATSAGPESGPDRVSTPGPAAAPKLAPGNGPSPQSAGPEAATNAPKAAGAPAAGASTGSRARPTGSRRQAARKVAKSVRRGGGGGGGTASAPAPVRSGGQSGGRPAPAAGAKPKKEAPAPDVSNATPESGLATAGSLKPHQALETLRGVDGAVGRSVEKERSTLRKAPPTTQRPSGSPRTVPGGPTPAAPGTYTNAKVARTEAAAGKTPEITGDQKPEGEVPGANVPEPSWWDIAVTIGAQLFGKLLKEILPLDDLIDSILGLPTQDEGLQKAKVGDAPRLPLENDSDPQRTDEQSGKLDERKRELHQAGRDDAARPMGEDQLYPDVPKETLTGKVTAGKKGAKASGPRSVSGGVPIESASAVAEHDRGPQIQAGFAEGRQKMGQERQAKDKKATDDRKQHDEDLKREVDASGKKQADARDKGRSDISDSRDKWRKEQDDKVGEIDDKKGKKYDTVRKDIKKKEEDTDKDVDKRTEDDNKKIETEQTNAEQEAEKKQNEGKDDADNWLEEAIEKLKEFFETLKNAIKSVFEKARQIVTDLIDKFKQQVFKLIDDARNWVIDQINTFADALIALGDELLADYPAMRDKWRNTIDGARDWAVQKVNEFADALKEVAGKLLDGLCGALLAGLDMLETGLLAAVDVAESVTVGALEFGAAVVAGLGEWAAIFNDIVSDPGDWISKAGAAAETGAKEHLFNEIKTAVKAWFNQKVQEIIGVPMEDFQELISGGVTVEQMAQMAWDEALPQLPVIIGVMVVEKVVAKLIPGAGWVMAVIDALQTAWGALSEILAAFGLFMDFLKSVKSGNGALPFAKAVAAGVVALLELVYTFLIEGVSRFMGKVAERLGDMLKNLRTKKNRPGQPDTPDQPSTPNKPKDEKPKDDKGNEEKPKDDDPAATDKRADRPAPRKPSPNKTSRPRSTPRPGKRSSPEKKQRPSHTTRPKKRRDDDERREDGREVNAARKRMRDAERTTHDKDRDGRTDTTRRGPARDTLRPDRRRPDRRDDRDRDHDPKDRRPGRRRTDDRRRDDDRRWDNDRKDDRRHDTDKDRRPGDRPRRRPLKRARQTVKSAVNRARRAAGRLFGKARRGIGSRLNDRLRRLRDQWRRRQERSRDRDRDRSRTRDRDRQREQEGRRDYDLPHVRFRTTDGDPHTLLFKGKGKSADLATRSRLQDIQGYFDGWRKEIAELKDSAPALWARQDQALKASKDQHTVVESGQDALPPSRSSYGISSKPLGDRAFQLQLENLKAQMEYLAELLEQRQSAEGEPPLPPTVLPPFADGPLAYSFKASYIKDSTPAGTEAENRTGALPEGWNAVPTANDERKNNWVRMHMLPARLGGHASTSNLVPARKINNNDAANVVEHPAARSLGHVIKGVGPTREKERMIWYDVDISYWPTHAGFPKNVNVTWGGYRVENHQWIRERNSKGSWPGKFDPPGKPSTINVNTAAAPTIRAATGISPHFAEAIVKIRDTGVVFNRFSELRRALQARLDLGGAGGVASGSVNENRTAAIKQLKDAEHMLRYTD